MSDSKEDDGRVDTATMVDRILAWVTAGEKKHPSDHARLLLELVLMLLGTNYALGAGGGFKIKDLADAILLLAYQANNENVTHTAQFVGLGRATVIRHLQRLGMVKKREDDLDESCSNG